MEEISDIPANAHLEQTVPHSAVLQRGQLLVSHAGHGSVMKALWHGRPTVLMPWGREQPGVAARAQALGVAEVVQRGDNVKPRRRTPSAERWAFGYAESRRGAFRAATSSRARRRLG